MYKAMYYPHGTFLTAKIGSNPSFVWRSVLETQSLLKAGITRRVGHGVDTSIVKDLWLPSVENLFIQTNHAALVDKIVVSLMSTDNAGWDVDLIRDIFTNRDANLIFSIPVQRDQEDSWYWRHEKMGSYSVKSAYSMIREQKEVQHSGNNSGLWRKLWNLKVPLKVKHLLWRAVSGILPTKDLLILRRVDLCSLCPVCNLSDELAVHALVSCDFRKLCWEKIEFMRGVYNGSSFTEWFSEKLQNHNSDELKVLSMVCWSLWNNRNNIV